MPSSHPSLGLSVFFLSFSARDWRALALTQVQKNLITHGPSAELGRDRQAAAAQDEAEENDATEEEMTRERTTRVGRPRGGMKAAARSGERLRREIGRGRLPRVGDG